MMLSFENMLEGTENTQQLYEKALLQDHIVEYAFESYIELHSEDVLSMEASSSILAKIGRGIIKFFKAIWEMMKRLFRFLGTTAKKFLRRLSVPIRWWKKNKNDAVTRKYLAGFKERHQNVYDHMTIEFAAVHDISIKADTVEDAQKLYKDILKSFSNGKISQEKLYQDKKEAEKTIEKLKNEILDPLEKTLKIRPDGSVSFERMDGKKDLSPDAIDGAISSMEILEKVLEDLFSDEKENQKMEEFFLNGSNKYYSPYGPNNKRAQAGEVLDTNLIKSYTDIIRSVRLAVVKTTKSIAYMNTKTMTSLNQLLTTLMSGNYDIYNKGGDELMDEFAA